MAKARGPGLGVDGLDMAILGRFATSRLGLAASCPTIAIAGAVAVERRVHLAGGRLALPGRGAGGGRLEAGGRCGGHCFGLVLWPGKKKEMLRRDKGEEALGGGEERGKKGNKRE